MEKYQTSNIPENPGVYLFLGKNGEILYVGKAKNLRNRVSSYFVKTDKPYKIIKMVKQAVDVKFVVTTSESEALLLEATIIKTEQPKYNFRLKDSKSYPYIKITGDNFPKLLITRNTSEKNCNYYGPFVNVGDLRNVVDEILRVFPLRSCTERKFNENKLCIKYQIKKCYGPCEGKISKSEYIDVVKQINDFFNGYSENLKETLTKQMLKKSDEMKFEDAARLRDRLKSIDRLFSGQSVILADDSKSIDVFTKHEINGVEGITTLFIRGGKLIGSNTEFMEDYDPENVLETYIMQFYSNLRQFPDSIAVTGGETSETLITALSQLKKGKISLRQRGLKKLYDLALENAEVQTELHLKKIGKREDVAERLKELIDSENEILSIDCVDISHQGGNHTVGVSVCSVQGEFAKSRYRKYKITSASNDDFTSLYEMFCRKFNNIAENSEKQADLYIIDGGIGQLNSVLKAADDCRFSGNFISISKGRSIKDLKNESDQSIESIHLPGRKNPVKLKKNDPLLLFTQKMRDEAHRFAITYSRKLALKNFKASPLLKIEGVGESRLKNILSTYPDIHTKVDLTADDIHLNCKIPLAAAEKIIEYLRGAK